jgi:hypothetical protein
MSYESTAEPIKIGYLMDFKLPPGFPEEMLADFTRCFDIVFEEAFEQTRVSFGKWTRRAWMGSGYLVARTLDADGVNSHLVDRFGEE